MPLGNALIESAPFWRPPDTKGLRSRARSRASALRPVSIWVNRALVALRQLNRGTLSDELLESEEAGWEGGPSPWGHPLTRRVAEVVGRSWSRREAGAPVGAAAVARQRGAAPLPSQRQQQGSSPLPRRGQTWPADVTKIALPVIGGQPVSMTSHSRRCREWLEDWRSRMLKDSEEVGRLKDEMRVSSP